MYGSAGASRLGASATLASVALGAGVEVMSPRKPVKGEAIAVATRPSAPLATSSTPTPSATTATTRSIRNGSAIPGPRSTRRCEVKRVEEGGGVRAFGGAGRPVEGGGGRTWGGRAPRRFVTARIVARAVRATPRRPNVDGASSLPANVVSRRRSVVVLAGPARGTAALECADPRDWMQARDPKRDRPAGSGGRPAFGVGPIARVSRPPSY